MPEGASQWRANRPAAASAGSSDLGCQNLVGAAQYRAGNRQEALETLEQTQPWNESAEFASSPQICSARANRLLGETMLALIDHELGNNEVFAKRLEALRKTIGSLKSTALQYCDDDEKWRIGLAVLYAERELVRLQSAIKP
jgi:hypothetical protein